MNDQYIKNQLNRDLIKYRSAVKALNDIKVDMDCGQCYIPVDDESPAYIHLINTIMNLNEMIKQIIEDLKEFE